MLYAQREGKSRYGDKTPGLYPGDAPDPARAPGGPFRPHHPRRSRRLALAHANELGARDLCAVGPPVAQPIRKARKTAPSINHYMEIKFEDLVADTEGVLRGVCDFIEPDRPRDARLPRARRGAARGEGARAAAQEPPAPAGRGEAREPPPRHGAPPRSDRVGNVAGADDARGGRRVRGCRRRHAGPDRPSAGERSGRAARSARRPYGPAGSAWAERGDALAPSGGSANAMALPSGSGTFT